MEWLDESEKTLDSDVEIANEPDKVKTQLVQHKVMNHNFFFCFHIVYVRALHCVYSIVSFN